jgi:hypothetical protein
MNTVLVVALQISFFAPYDGTFAPFGSNFGSSFTECWDLPTSKLEFPAETCVAKLEIRGGKRVAALNPM